MESYQSFSSLGKGPNLNKVKDALLDYETGKSSRTVKDELVKLRVLIEACKTWIKTKESKSEYRKNRLGMQTSYYNTKFLDRKTRVAQLGKDATQELLTLLENHDLLQQDQRGQLTFDMRKFEQKGKRQANRYETKSLSSGYEQERQSWIDSNKTTAYSGSKIHGMLKTGGLPNTANLKNSKQKSAVKSIAKGGGSASDWKVLSQVDKIGDLRVAFAKKAQRIKYLVFVDDNGKFTDEDGTRIDTKKNGPMSGQVLWAMDRYGNMFVYDDWAFGKDLGIGQVNHSSMNAGKEVICAGMIIVEDGEVTYLTNTSGHYKPTNSHLANAMEILLSEGLDLSNAAILTVRLPGPAKGQAYWQTYDPIQFVNSNGTCQPLKTDVGPEP